MNVRKIVHISMVIVGSVFLVTQYQNCAPPSAGLNQSTNGASSLKGADSGLPVTVIDPVAKDPVSFNQKAVQSPNASQPVSIQGQCVTEHGGVSLGWFLYDGNQLMNQGSADCVSDQFQIQVSKDQNLECGKLYRLSAAMGAGQQDEAAVSWACSTN